MTNVRRSEPSSHDRFASLKACRSATREWVVKRVRAGRVLTDPLPQFGSVAWHKLPDGDPVKAAALVAAAYARYLDLVNLEQNLADEIEARRAAEAKIDAEEWDRATARIRKISTAPSWAKRQQQWRGTGDAS